MIYSLIFVLVFIVDFYFLTINLNNFYRKVMAKKSIIQREKKRKLLSSKYYVLRKILTDKIKSSISFEEKLFFYSQLQKLPRDSSFSRLF
jgi:hypothetical protein